MILSMLIALLAGAAPPAEAQLVPKQAVVNDFAACVARQADGRVRAALVTEFSSPEERKAISSVALAHPACLKGRRYVLSLQTGVMRGALAAAMLAKEPALLQSFSARPDGRPFRPAPADGRAFVIAYASCLAQSKPAHTGMFLGTPIASAEERTAYEAYGETLMACMPEGLRYTSNITDVRNHVAAIVYRRATERTGA